MTPKNIKWTDRDSALDIHDNIVPVGWVKNQSFTWTSERDGWLHLYKVSRDGKEAAADHERQLLM